tara:strand:+ start:2012 stop:2389 length:378 start_codon:yes stop_codon:yes gene_type:complete
MNYKDVPNNDFIKYKQGLIIDAYQKYYDWWHPIDIRNGSFLSVSPRHTFLEHLLIYEDEYYFDRWFNEEDFIIGVDGDIKSSRTRMKRFIMHYIIFNTLGYYNINSDTPFKRLKEDNEDDKNELR